MFSAFTFEPTISAGVIVQTVVLLIAVIRGYIAFNNRMTLMENNINSLERSSEGFARSFEQLSKVLTQVAVQDVRILGVEKRIDELAHGKGLIK